MTDGDVDPAVLDNSGEDDGSDDELVDEMVVESFPGSDPPSTWAGSDEPGSGRAETK